MEKINKPEVFISYAHKDAQYVETIAKKIMAEGFNCWIDSKQLRVYARYNAEIDHAIEDAIVFIVFLSKNYVNQPYCVLEFDLARNYNKTIMTICLDDVNEHTNPECAYVFSSSVGHTIRGYGHGIQNHDSIGDVVDDIVDSLPMRCLRRYNSSGNMDDLPPITTPDYMVKQLRDYHEKQYRQSGNYALNEIRSELFPSLVESGMDRLYEDPDHQNVSLINYLTSQDDNSHLLLLGEGGMGKTVSLLQTCSYLLDQGINAIYVPMSKIDQKTSVMDYIYHAVFNDNDSLFHDLNSLISYSPQRQLVLLLDGINEMSLPFVDKVDCFKKYVKDELIEHKKGVQLVMSTRWYDYELLHSIESDVMRLELLPLDHSHIQTYLEHVGLPSVTNTTMLNVLSTPLLLTLYADVEKHRDKYETIKGIKLYKNPNSAGRILGNFFQTQLYRAAEEANFNRTEHLILLEYVLPMIAYEMYANNQSMYIEEDDLWDCLYEIEEQPSFQYYKRDRLMRLLKGRVHFDEAGLLALAENDLHFLNETEGQYSFSHQNFRDYFVAYHIANEMKALKRPERLKEITPIITEQELPFEILRYISDITEENQARPYCHEGVWCLPGKTKQGASSLSISESLLDLWRHQEGRAAQMAVKNLLSIITIGREHLLLWMDLSCLDLRACQMNGVHFVDWYKEDLYPTNFNGAYIDREFFFGDGHDGFITAVTTVDHLIISGDDSGYVKIYDQEKREFIDSIHIFKYPIQDLAARHHQVAILYKQDLYLYDLSAREITHYASNADRGMDYRYVTITEDDQILYSYNLEPLTYRDINGNVVNKLLQKDIPVKTAAWHPNKREYIRSSLFHELTIERYNDKKKKWLPHPVLKNELETFNQQRFQEGGQRHKFARLNLDHYPHKMSGADCIVYYPDGTRFLVAIGNALYEYDDETLTLLRSKTFAAMIESVCYDDHQIIVGAGRDLIVLNEEFSELYVVRGSQARTIVRLQRDPYQNGYWLTTKNGDMKHLDNNLCVQRIRHKSNYFQQSFTFVVDRQTQHLQFCILPNYNNRLGKRYNFDTNETEPLGWCYEIVDVDELSPFTDEQCYIIGSTIERYQYQKHGEKDVFKNYAGIWIFGCTFYDIKGTLSLDENKELIKMNGGEGV